MPVTETTLTLDAAGDARAVSFLPPPPLRLNRPALFLDLDGVLAPLAPTPDAVVADPRRTSVLTRLVARLDGRVAIISGRTIAEIDRILDHGVAAASGVHGLERRIAGRSMTRAEPAQGMREAVVAFQHFARLWPGVLVEDKGLATTLHIRGAPHLANEAEDLALTLARRTGLSFQPGVLVYELKTPGASKGTALSAFMAEPPFIGSTPVMLGDDLTDEDGFKAAAEAGGFGVLVGMGRKTAATHGLSGPGAVLEWLDKVEAAA